MKIIIMIQLNDYCFRKFPYMTLIQPIQKYINYINLNLINILQNGMGIINVQLFNQKISKSSPVSEPQENTFWYTEVQNFKTFEQGINKNSQIEEFLKLKVYLKDKIEVDRKLKKLENIIEGILKEKNP